MEWGIVPKAVNTLSDLSRDTRVTFFRIDFAYDFSFFFRKTEKSFSTQITTVYKIESTCAITNYAGKLPRPSRQLSRIVRRSGDSIL